MSQWTEVDGDLKGVKGTLSDGGMPTGSESGPTLRSYARGHWMWYGNLRDMGEEDAPELRDWFAALCRRAQPTEASLTVDVGSGGRYDFTWDTEQQELVLEIPPLYREAIRRWDSKQ